MQCPNCGLGYGDDLKNCPKCGANPTQSQSNDQASQSNAVGCFSIIYGLGMLGGVICIVVGLGAGAFNLRGVVDPLMKLLFISAIAIAIGKIGLEIKKR